jgi:hypothetical protein
MASSPRRCSSRAQAKLDQYPLGLVLGGCVLFAALTCALAAPPLTPAAPATPSTLGPVCLASGNGYLRARLNGDIDKDIDWANAGTECQGMPRPDGHGLRLSFARTVEPGGRRLVIVFGVASIGENQSGKALPANITLIVEGPTRIFGTRGDDKCLVDRLRSQPLAGDSHSRIYRIEAHGFCTQPARAVLGSGAVLISTFDFAGKVSFEESTPQPPGHTGLTS